MVGCLIYLKGVRVSERRPIKSAYLCLPKTKNKKKRGEEEFLSTQNSPSSFKRRNTHGFCRFSPLGHHFCAFASIFSVFGHSIQVSALPFGF